MADAEPITLDVTEEDGRTVIRPVGDWLARTLNGVDGELRGLAARVDPAAVAIDLTRLGRIDTAGAYVLGRVLARSPSPDADIHFVCSHPSARQLIALARERTVHGP